MTVVGATPANRPVTSRVDDNSTRIVVSESSGLSPSVIDRLRQLGDVKLEDLDRGELLDAVEDVEILWVRLRHRIDEEVFNAAPHLKFLVTATTGLNHIDLEMAEQRGVRVLSLRGEADFLKQIRATAELTIGLMLALLRHIPAATNHVRPGGWNRDLFQGRELFGKTIGIVGYGRLGKIVARYLSAFDARVLVADPEINKTEMAEGVQLVPLERLLQESDLVTLHVNLSAQTQTFFGRQQFARMRLGSWLINTSRGELLDEDALAEALRSGHLAGAALDVLCNETATGMGTHPLVALSREHPHLIITPHIGGCTSESMTKTEEFMVERLWEVCHLGDLDEARS